jgi:hypothetical protein
VSAFTISNHNKDVTVRSMEFRGGLNSVGIDMSCAVQTNSAYRDLTVERCTFRATTAAMIGIRFVNARESYVTDCHFVQSESLVNYYLTGVYLVTSINVVISRCTMLYAEYGCHSYGTPVAGTVNPFDVGPAIDHCRMLGCKYGVLAEYNDFVGVNDSVIDFCNNPIVIYGSESPIIRGNYISSRENNPAVSIGPGSRFPAQGSSNAILDGNHILVHDSGAGPWTHPAMDLDALSVGTVANNIIENWRGRGIHRNGCTHLSVFNNAITPEDTYGTYAIDATTDASSERIGWNLLGKPVHGQLNSMTDWNRFVNVGDRLEGTQTAKGATLLAAGQTSVTVNPGVGRTLAFAVATPSKNTPFWVDTFAPNAFTIRIPVALGADCAFYWFAGTNYSFIQPQP